MLLIDIRFTNASAAEFILDRLKLYLAGRHHHHTVTTTGTVDLYPSLVSTFMWVEIYR